MGNKWGRGGVKEDAHASFSIFCTSVHERQGQGEAFRISSWTAETSISCMIGVRCGRHNSFTPKAAIESRHPLSHRSRSKPGRITRFGVIDLT